MPIDCLNSSVPVYDPDENGCYRWMSVKAGQNSTFCANVDIKGDTNVENINVNQDISVIGDINVTGTINHNGSFDPELPLTTEQITCDETEVVPAGTDVNEAIKLVSDYYCDRLDNLPTPSADRSILSLQLNTNRQYNTGTIEPPFQLYWDQQVSTSPDFAYGSGTGLITILTPGLYKFSTTLVASIEAETIVETSKVQLYLAESNIVAPPSIVLINQSTFSGQDGLGAHTSEKLLSITSVPFTVATAVSIRDPIPAELVQLIGAVGFTNGDGFTNVTVERLGDAQPVIDVSTGGGS